MKNRMRELRSFGSVRGEGSDVLAYSENRPEAVVRLTQKPPFPAMEGAAAWPWQYRLTARRPFDRS